MFRVMVTFQMKENTTRIDELILEDGHRKSVKLVDITAVSFCCVLELLQVNFEPGIARENICSKICAWLAHGISNAVKTECLS